MPALLRFVFVLLIGLAFPVFTGCHPAATGAFNPEMPYPLQRDPQVGEILHIPTGVLVTERQMLDIATDAHIIYVGETHDNPASHRLELELLRATAERYPGRTALGMEMFTPSQQHALDRWVSGEIDEKEFLKSSRWYDNWGMDFDYYRPLLQFARERKIPVIGLNAEKGLVKALGRTDAAGLPPELKAELPEMDMNDPYQRALVEAIYGGHAGGKDRLEAFLRVQTLWDETMAQNVAAYLAAPEHAGGHMVVVAGGNHVRQGFGIPRRVFRRLPASYVLVGSREIVIPPDKQDRLMDVSVPEFPFPLYDFLMFTAYEDLGKQEVHLGVLVEAQNQGLQVKEVLPGSAAEAAGLKRGDRLLQFDGRALKDTFDLSYAVKQKTVGDTAVLLVNRKGETLTIEAVFRKPGEGRP